MSLSRYLVFLTLTSAAVAEDNQTVIREEAGDIPSIYYDLRLEPMGVQSGLPPAWPHAIASLTYDQDVYEWSSQSIMLNAPGSAFNPNGQPLREQRRDLSVELRQSLWTPFPWDAEMEVDGAVVQRRATTGDETIQGNTLLVSDPRVQLLFPVWQERYAGVLLGGGVSLPSGEKSDWFAAHDTIGMVLSARWTSAFPGIPWLTMGFSGEYRWAGQSNQVIYAANPVLDVTCNYSGFTYGGELTYRLTRVLSAGVTLVAREDEFQNIQVPGLQQPIEESIRTNRLGAFVTLMCPNQTFWMVTVKQVKDLQGWSGRNLAIGAQVAVVAW